MDPREHGIDGRGAHGQAVVGGQGGVGVAHGLAQADQGAHGIEQEAFGGRQGLGHRRSLSQLQGLIEG